MADQTQQSKEQQQQQQQQQQPKQQPAPKVSEHQQRMQQIRRERYLSTIRVLPDLRKKKTQDYFEVILTLAALIVAVVFAIYPAIITIVDLQKQLQDEQSIEQQASTKVQALSSLNRAYTNLQAKFPVIYNAIPKTDDTYLLAAEIQAIAQKDHLAQNQMTVTPDTMSATAVGQAVPSAAPQQPGLLANFTFSGSAPDIEQFLQDIISFQRIVTIPSVTISHKAPDKPVILTITVKGYYLP